jgi:hypothetical protein
MEGSFQPCSPVPPFTWSRLKTRSSATPALRAAGFAPEASSTVLWLFVSSSLCTPLFHSLPAVISFVEHLILCSRVASPSLHSFTHSTRGSWLSAPYSTPTLSSRESLLGHRDHTISIAEQSHRPSFPPKASRSGIIGIAVCKTNDRRSTRPTGQLDPLRYLKTTESIARTVTTASRKICDLRRHRLKTHQFPDWISDSHHQR